MVNTYWTKMMNNKRGFFPVAITAGLLLAFAVVVVVFFGGAAFLTWVLSKTVFFLVGATILILAGVALVKGIKIPVYVWAIGVGLILLPNIFKALKEITLASIVGGG